MKEQHHRNKREPDLFPPKAATSRHPPPPCYAYPMPRMLLAKIVAFIISATAFISIVITHSDRWAHSLQQYYIRTSKKAYGESAAWGQPWIKTLCKCLVIFFGFMSVVGLYAAFFAPPPGTLPPAVSTAEHVGHCSLIMPIEQSQALIDRLYRSTASFASTTRDLMGETTEGGAQVTYTQGGVRQIVEQRFYGETGRSVARIYYTSGKPFALIVQGMKYAVPLSVDNNGTVQSTEQRAIFSTRMASFAAGRWMASSKRLQLIPKKRFEVL